MGEVRPVAVASGPIRPQLPGATQRSESQRRPPPASSCNSVEVRDRPAAAVWCATAMLALLVVLWSVDVPLYRAVDEPQHLSTVLRLAAGDGYPPPGSGRLRPEVAASYRYADFPGGDARTFVPPRAVRALPAPFPSFRQLETRPVPLDQVGQPDQMTQHPPLWPLLAAAEVRLLGLRAVPADIAVVTLRVLQGLLLLPMPLLIWRTARRLGAGRAAAAAAGFVPLLAPQLLHIGASVTDGDLLLLEFALTTPLLVAVTQGPRSTTRAVALGLVVAAALLTKSFALLLPGCVVLAFAAGAGWRLRHVAWRPLLVALGLPVVLAGWWYMLRLASTGSIQPSGYPDGFLRALAGRLSPGAAFEIFVGSVLKTSWRDLGWFETPGSLTGALAVWLTVAAPVVVTLCRRDTRGPVVVALAPFVLLTGLVCALEVSVFVHLHAVYGAQGRYLFPGLVGVAGVAAVSLSGAGRLATAARLALPLGCLVAQGFGLRLAGRYFWVGGQSAALAWSPVPADVLAPAAVVAVLLALAAAVGVVRTGQREGPTPAAGRACAR